MSPLLGEGGLEVAAELRGINDQLDLFGFRDGLCTGCDDGQVGDAAGGRLLVNYGLTAQITVVGEWGKDRIDIGFGDAAINQWRLAGRFSPYAPLLVEAGLRGHELAPLTVSSPADLNRLIGYIDRRVTLRDIGSHLLISDGTTNLYLLKSGEQLYLRHGSSRDLTLYGRAALVTNPAARVRGGAFVEIGTTHINGRIDSNYPQLVGTRLAARTMSFPLDLDRDERFVKVGGQLTVSALLGAYWNLSYSYERIDRGEGLGYVDYNHVVAGDLLVPVADGWSLAIGGTYYRRQLNGEVPLLYSRYTQTTFDHDYGLARIGVVYTY